MKKTLFKIMSLALTIAMLASLIIAIVPAGALTVVSAAPSSATISATPVTYTVTFTGAINLAAPAALAATTTYAPSTRIVVTTAGTLTGDATIVATKNGTAINNATWQAGVAVVATDVVVVTTAGQFANIGTTVGIAGGDTVTVVFPVGTVVPAAPTITFNNGNGSGDLAATVGAVVVPAAGIVTLTVPVAATVGYAWVVKIGGLTNPGTAGSFTLTVSTSRETTAVTSAAYTIGAPGIVQVYNQSGSYLGTFDTLAATDAAYSPFPNYMTIKVAPGTYTATGFTLDGNYVTLVSTGAGVTLRGGITIAGTFNTVDSLTLVGQNTVSGTFATIKNCTLVKTAFPAAPETLLTVNGATFTLSASTVDTSSPSGQQDIGVQVNTATATITGVTFKVDQSIALLGDTAVNAAATATVKNSTFTGVNGGFGVVSAAASTITGNTFTGLQTAINTSANATISTNNITGCITNGTAYVGAVVISGGVVTASSNTIKDNTGYSFQITGIAAGSQLSGNNMSGNTKGFTSAVAVNAILNYWGAASGPLNATTNPTGTGDAVSANVTYRPFLTTLSSAATSYIADAVVPGAETFDASLSPAGFVVANYDGAAGAVIIGQKLSANPKTIEPAFPAVQYFDIFTSAASTTAMQVKLYATGLTTASQVYYWSGLTNTWMLCSSQGVAGTGDYVYVNFNPAAGVYGVFTTPNTGDLTGTAFVIVKGFAPAPPTFLLTSPAAGATTALSGVPFTWPTVAGANSYQIAISKSADLSSPVIATTAGTAYIYPGNLLDKTAYFWQVSALQNTTVIAKSNVGAFIAQAPPVIATTPQITITTQPAATITITQPQQTVITFTTPATTTITPAWIWGIIGVGAVLVIVVIVLIVRTRRTT